jgi:hypothetical protein
LEVEAFEIYYLTWFYDIDVGALEDLRLNTIHNIQMQSRQETARVKCTVTVHGGGLKKVNLINCVFSQTELVLWLQSDYNCHPVYHVWNSGNNSLLCYIFSHHTAQ